MYKTIFKLIAEGKTAEEIITLGFPKSTVYWSIKQFSKGIMPRESKPKEPAYMLAYRKANLIHDCGEGRTGMIEEDSIWGDNGITFRKYCTSCGVTLATRFEKWTPEAKERYIQWKDTGIVNYNALGPLDKAKAPLTQRLL